MNWSVAAKVGKAIIGSGMFAAAATAATSARPCDEVRGALELLQPIPNQFADYDFTDRQRLLQGDKMWSTYVLLAERRDQAQPDCGTELYSIERGFRALEPSSPLSRNDMNTSLSWRNHVQFQYFPDLVTCATRERLIKALEQIDAERLPVTPIPQRIDMFRNDFSTSDR